MLPSITIGAVILLCRKAATKVIVFHSPRGTCPINLTPRGARPLSRTMLVLTAVSSIKTSRAGSSMPCSRIQRRRARATSARCRSSACRLFFEGDAVSAKKPRNRTLAGLDSSLEQFRNRLHQSQVWPFGDQSQYLLRMRFQGRDTSSTGLRRGAPDLVPALHKPDRRTRTDDKTIGRLAPRQPIQSHSFNHPFPQVT